MKNLKIRNLKTALFSLLILLSLTTFSRNQGKTLSPPFNKVYEIEESDIKKKQISHRCSKKYMSKNNIGLIFSNNKDRSAAINYFKESLILKPNDVYVKFNLANTYLKDNCNENAIVLYLEIINDVKIDKELVKLYLAKAYEQNMQYKKALKYYGSTNRYEGAYNASVIYRNIGEIEKAIEQANRALNLTLTKQLKLEQDIILQLYFI